MHECERIRSLPREEILEKARKILEEPRLEWDEKVLERKTEKYWEKDRRKWVSNRIGGLYSATSKSWQMQVSRGIEVSVEEVLRKSSLTAEVSRMYRGTTQQKPRIEARSIHQVSRSYRAYKPNLDRSTGYWGAGEIAIRKSFRKLDG